MAPIKAAGKYRQEGKTYVVQDGDIVHFQFSKFPTLTLCMHRCTDEILKMLHQRSKDIEGKKSKSKPERMFHFPKVEIERRRKAQEDVEGNSYRCM